MSYFHAGVKASASMQFVQVLPNTWIPDSWYVACTEASLGSKLKSLVISEIPMVIFRHASGTSALLNRCPHRHVPLSEGTLKNGTLQCRYHGWKFDSTGACIEIPGHENHEPLKSQCVASYTTQSKNGFIWIYSTPNVNPVTAPPDFLHLNSTGYSTVVREYVVPGTQLAFLENTLDVPHTSFLHRGLFRTPKKSNLIDVNVSRTGAGAQAEFIGEPVPKGLAGKLLAPGGGIVKHVDRFVMPHTAQVEYSLGEKSHFIATSVLTPIDENETRVFAVVTFKLPIPAFLVKPFVAPVATRIFRQDAHVLKSQRDNAKQFGETPFVSTEIDVLGPQIYLLLKAAMEKREVIPHSHLLKMRT
jgi:phenylpropionate dioxygenase-like ring-hydroxylating dioxygenase large terminal subunit